MHQAIITLYYQPVQACYSVQAVLPEKIVAPYKSGHTLKNVRVAQLICVTMLK
jgi:hypothetical protein